MLLLINKKSQANGIEISGAQSINKEYIKLVENEIINASNTGILIKGGSYMVIDHNAIKGSGNKGLDVVETTDSSICNNRLFDNSSLLGQG